MLVFPAHLLIVWALGLLAPIHFIVDGILLALYAARGKFRDGVHAYVPMWASICLYDVLKVFFRFRPDIHVDDIYHAEKWLFGFTYAGARVTPNEFFRVNTVAALDFLCGLTYLLYLVPLVSIAMILFFRDRPRLRLLSWAILIMHVVAFVTYIAVPVAPPWYVGLYGLGPADLSTPPHAAGALRFDQLVGAPILETWYQQNRNVFAAVPSMHAGIQTTIALVLAGRSRFWAVLTWSLAGLMYFSAVYLDHHYILDLVVGAAYAGLAVLAVRLVDRWRGITTIPVAVPKA